MLIWFDIFPKLHLNILTSFRRISFYIRDGQTDGNNYTTIRFARLMKQRAKSSAVIIRFSSNSQPYPALIPALSKTRTNRHDANNYVRLLTPSQQTMPLRMLSIAKIAEKICKQNVYLGFFYTTQ